MTTATISVRIHIDLDGWVTSDDADAIEAIARRVNREITETSNGRRKVSTPPYGDGGALETLAREIAAARGMRVDVHCDRCARSRGVRVCRLHKRIACDCQECAR